MLGADSLLAGLANPEAMTLRILGNAAVVVARNQEPGRGLAIVRAFEPMVFASVTRQARQSVLAASRSRKEGERRRRNKKSREIACAILRRERR